MVVMVVLHTKNDRPKELTQVSETKQENLWTVF